MTKLKIIKRPAVRYFSIFLFEIQKMFLRKFSTFIYNPQALPGSLKISNVMFLANLVYRVRSHPSAWHGWTRSPKNFIFLFEIYQFRLGKYFTFIYNPQALLESEKIRTWSVSPTPDTKYLENFHRTLPDTVFELLNVQQSDIFPYFSLKNTKFYWKYFIFIKHF